MRKCKINKKTAHAQHVAKESQLNIKNTQSFQVGCFGQA